MTKTIRRNWLKKQIELGKVEAKCNYCYTDDYAFDNSVNFQRTEWMPARIAHPTTGQVALYNGNIIDKIVDDDCKDGFMNFHDYDFTFKSGFSYWQDDNTIRFCPLSNESYTLRIVA